MPDQGSGRAPAGGSRLPALSTVLTDDATDCERDLRSGTIPVWFGLVFNFESTTK